MEETVLVDGSRGGSLKHADGPMQVDPAQYALS